jgi:uridine kinase
VSGESASILSDVGYDAAATARTVVELAQRAAPTLGSGRLVCVDGPAGSGKTTLADTLGRLEGAPVLHTDDLLDGWDGLPCLSGALAGLLAPLADGRPGRAPRYDWHAGRFAGEVVVDPVPLLVVEGVGAGSLPAAGRATLLVWVEAPHDLRKRRGLDRDGEVFTPHWEAWAKAEAAHFADHRTRERADLVVDGTGRRPPRLTT